MRIVFCMTCLCVALVGCNTTPTGLVKTEDRTDLYYTQGTETDIAAAKKEAFNTLNNFEQALKDTGTRYADFALKMRFITAELSEYMWLTGITLKDGKYYGVVDNDPAYTTKVHFGDSIEIPRDRISDWLYTDSGVLRGGYTIRVIRNRMSAKEREEFDASSGYIIED